jgi:predicted metal-dependent phosphoesterase TrpH
MSSKFADLHVHTHFSDGTFSPQQVVQGAIKAGLSCVSITDHDTTAAIDPAIKAAGEDLEIIPGVELTAEFGGQEIHILGYLIDHRNKPFLKMLQKMQKIRVQRIYGICKKLKKQGVLIEPEEIFSLAGSGSVGRLHVARALYEKGHVFSIPDAFYRYIGDKGPAYVGKFKMTPKEAVGWILKIRGIPVLAHPHTIGDRALISDFVKAGIMGLEAFYPEHSQYQREEFIRIAEKQNLLVTGGSDCHGEGKGQVCLGKVKLPYSYVEKLKEAQCRLK